jgi:PilZ domain
MTKKENDFVERRKHARLPIIHGILEPVDLSFEDENSTQPKNIPGILSNLSASGMRLMTFLESPSNKALDMHLSLPGLGKFHIQGRISWIREKGGVFMSGIAFTKISENTQHKINMMAEDYADCETRIALKLPEVCIEKCRCHHLCNKLQKDETFFENKDNDKKD